jgi:hypothetical protein
MSGYCLTIGGQTRRKAGEDQNVIEIFVQGKEDMVVITFPYKRYDSIKPTIKNYYSTNSNIDKRHNIDDHFRIRPSVLIQDSVVGYVIFSNKYLETSFGISIKKELKCYVAAMYGQGEWILNANFLTRRDGLKRGGVFRWTYLN